MNAKTVTDSHGTTFEPWSDGWAVGFKVTTKQGTVRHVYLNPSSESDDGVSNVFLYEGSGEPDEDSPLVYVDVAP